MKIAIIGSGNVGGTLGVKWSKAGHDVVFGVRNLQNFKGKELAENANIPVFLIHEAVHKSEVVLISTPSVWAVEVAHSLGNTSGKIIIDSMNIVMGRGPEGYKNATDALLDNTQSRDIVKCFNTMGANNLQNPKYGEQTLDLFVAGDSEIGKKAAVQLANDAGFEGCFDIGGNDKFELMEQFARFWINLAMSQGHGREFGFKLLKR